MKSTLRLFASIRPARFLTPGNPTGLTGLFTHPAPRSTLIYLYSSILEKLSAFPDHSIYRQSAEAITKARLSIIESVKPAGYDEWATRATATLEKYPEIASGKGMRDGTGDTMTKSERGGRTFLSVQGSGKVEDERVEEWDGEEVGEQMAEGGRLDEKKFNRALEDEEEFMADREDVRWEDEPPLEAQQIVDIENRIGGGLIEEVIQLAEGELKLADTMLQARVWEELTEKAPQGQWDYFARDQHTQVTQEPPK